MRNIHLYTKLVQKHLFLLLFLSILGVTGGVVVFKLLFSETTTVYARIKVSQGLWWATTQKTPLWLSDSLKKGDTETSMGGEPLVELLSVRKYPIGIAPHNNEQYETYLIAKIETSYSKKQSKYMFKRSPLAVGSPIDLELSSAYVSGTVMELSRKPILDKYKTVRAIISKQESYQWEYDSIELGDSYFDGEDTTFVVIDKSFEEMYDQYNGYPMERERPIVIYLTVEMKVKENKGILLYREDLPLQVGKKISIQTPSFFFDQYTVRKISQ